MNIQTDWATSVMRPNVQADRARDELGSGW
jgi:hypothetical protein